MIIRITLSPKIPKPTTQSPITAPPENAIESALFIQLSFAAFAVRTFAFVATFIPTYPANVESTAPTIKQTAVSQSIPNPNTTKSMATNTIKILYSENKNAFAPSAIAPEISFIFSFPASLLLIIAALIPAKITAMIPAIGAK